MWLIYLVHGATYNDVLAIFPRSPGGDAAAVSFIAANGGTKVEGEIAHGGIIVTPEIPVTPTT